MGVVIGATAGRTGLDLGRLNGPVLAPGLGAQGARPEDLAQAYAGLRGRVLPSSSREMLSHGPDTQRLRDAIDSVQIACRNALKNDDL